MQVIVRQNYYVRLNEKLAEYNLFFPPIQAAAKCVRYGMVANNASNKSGQIGYRTVYQV